MRKEEIDLEEDYNRKKSMYPMCSMCPCMQGMYMNPNMMSQQQMGYSDGRDESEDDFDEDFDEDDTRRRRPYHPYYYHPYYHPYYHRPRPMPRPWMY